MHCNKASAALGNFLNEVIADPPGEELYDALHMSLRVSGRILLFRIRGGSGTILRADGTRHGWNNTIDFWLDFLCCLCLMSCLKRVGTNQSRRRNGCR